MIWINTNLVKTNKADKKIIKKRLVKSKWRLMKKGFIDEKNKMIILDKDGNLSSNFIEREYFKLENNLANFYLKYNEYYRAQSEDRFGYKTLLDDLRVNFDRVDTKNLSTTARRKNQARILDNKEGLERYYDVKREILAIDSRTNVIVQNFHLNIMAAKYLFEENISAYLQGAYLANKKKIYEEEYQVNMKKVFEDIRKNYSGKYLEEEING